MGDSKGTFRNLPRKKRDYSSQLKVGDHQFESIADFARTYNLVYVSVVDRLKRGDSAEEILERLESRPQNPDKDRPLKQKGTPQQVSYLGVKYPSISAACKALGIPKNRIFYMTTCGVSPSEAIATLVAQDSKSENKGKRTPVTINGETYPSTKEASAAFGIPIQTVYSWMQRQQIDSFGEAVLHGSRTRTPWRSMWRNHSFVLVDYYEAQYKPGYNRLETTHDVTPALLATSSDSGEDLAESAGTRAAVKARRNSESASLRFVRTLCSCLAKKYRRVNVYKDRNSDIIALQITERLRFHNQDLDRLFYVLLRYPVPMNASEVELVVPNLLTTDKDFSELAPILNDMNTEYTGTNIYYKDGVIGIKAICHTSSSIQLAKSDFTRVFQRFAGTAAEIFMELSFPPDSG